MHRQPAVSWSGLVIIALALGLFGFDRLSKVFNDRKKTVDQILIGIGLTPGLLLAKLQVYVFDRMFCARGASIESSGERTSKSDLDETFR